jgi:hypothetical protein
MHMGHRYWILVALLGASVANFTGCSSTMPASSNPATAATAPAGTLSASVKQIDRRSGAVAINGVDTRRPMVPFLFEWDDGTSSQNFFPASHIYTDLRRNYIVKITATYEDGTKASVPVPVFFRE